MIPKQHCRHLFHFKYQQKYEVDISDPLGPLYIYALFSLSELRNVSRTRHLKSILTKILVEPSSKNILYILIGNFAFWTIMPTVKMVENIKLFAIMLFVLSKPTKTRTKLWPNLNCNTADSRREETFNNCRNIKLRKMVWNRKVRTYRVS